ncbi:type VI secretion system-associated protein TagF [Roseomonas sp. CECT 9278]|uniref:type VI secretion system-associated protein TagF n=1 Tax=Roseomonas sp. CECT 9278 TaxID=2845823 RepID=UPI001E5D4F4F|nr:type VI secretion system-associated protein TagF [Roseomonas sp. CECT 9278]CAH0300660.1 hypothetical protein ROS9278_04540 [Roseomonas sp. CECT 9278]
MPDPRPLSGLYGKVPAHGDFVRRGLPSSFVAPWDSWLAAGIAAARGQLGAHWDAAWDTAPAWRFALPAGACGPDAVAGVMLPSQDQVGRRFPITLAALLPPGAAPPGPDWFDALEGAARAGLAGQADADALAAAVPLPGAPILAQHFALPPILPGPPTDAEPLPWPATEAPRALPDPAHPDDDVLAMLSAPAAQPPGAAPGDGHSHDDVLALLATPAAPMQPEPHDDPLALLIGSAASTAATAPDPDGTLAGLIGAGAGDAPPHPGTGMAGEHDGTLAGLIGLPGLDGSAAAPSVAGDGDGILTGLTGAPAQDEPAAAPPTARELDGTLDGPIGVSRQDASTPGQDDGTLAGLVGPSATGAPTDGDDGALAGLVGDREAPSPALALAGGDAGHAATEGPDMLAETVPMGWPELADAHDAQPARDAHAAAPPAPEGGGWWTRGGAHVPPMVWPMPGLPDPADFAYLLEAAA